MKRFLKAMALGVLKTVGPLVFVLGMLYLMFRSWMFLADLTRPSCLDTMRMCGDGGFTWFLWLAGTGAATFIAWFSALEGLDIYLDMLEEDEE